ncbi:hypothetical protein PsorP6_010493 [Peronosclerospora sorghi]|uniref:Uncharacterized protein n=1 Tax=Peronosclerospora sorghi TaxID=230839 RepID=A0ACC0VW69_9STRA|nr:hypothetical protein PsorP6_010493 [Peronosclerospora sorghi]
MALDLRIYRGITSSPFARQNAKLRKRKRAFYMSRLLASLKISKYDALFEAEEIDIESLCLMNPGHLRDLGIPFGPRMKLVNAAALYEDEDDERHSMESTLVTPVVRFKQKRAEMKLFHAGLVRCGQQSAVRIAILTTEGELCDVGSGIIINEDGLIARARHCLHGEQFDCIYSDEYMNLIHVLTAIMEVSCPRGSRWTVHWRRDGPYHRAQLDSDKFGMQLSRNNRKITSAQLDNGFSGGAAVDKKGQLVGLVSFSVLRQDRLRAINMVKGAIEYASITSYEGQPENTVAISSAIGKIAR